MLLTKAKKTWKRIYGYPKQGDYARTEWKGKRFEGKITGKVVRFRTGYIAMEVIDKNRVKRWMPWTSRAIYEILE